MSPSAFAALKRAAARLELDRRERERRVRIQETCRRLSADVTRQMAEEREREVAERQRVQEALQQVTRTARVP